MYGLDVAREKHKEELTKFVAEADALKLEFVETIHPKITRNLRIIVRKLNQELLTKAQMNTLRNTTNESENKLLKFERKVLDLERRIREEALCVEKNKDKAK